MASSSSAVNDQPEEDASELIFPKGNAVLWWTFGLSILCAKTSISHRVMMMTVYRLRTGHVDRRYANTNGGYIQQHYLFTTLTLICICMHTLKVVQSISNSFGVCSQHRNYLFILFRNSQFHMQYKRNTEDKRVQYEIWQTPRQCTDRCLNKNNKHTLQ